MERASVPPPGWTGTALLPPETAPTAPAPTAPQQPPTLDTAADAAVRWRINAAVFDNILVYGGYVVACLVLHWRVAAPDHLLLLVVGSVGYHFALEARGGQTVGKRCYGIRVVAADGGPAGAKAIAIRSVLRIIDQLPVLYVSGLVSMVRTGPRRRQRLGDVAARTMVVAVDREVVRLGTPRWVLPAATTIALLVSAVTVYAAVTAGNRPLTDTQRAGFVDGCARGVDSRLAWCQCLLARLEADGYTTLNKIRDLDRQIHTRLGTAETELVAAGRSCLR